MSIDLQSCAPVAFLRANGAGKSSLLRPIVGMAPIKAGEILYDGADVTGRTAYEVELLQNPVVKSIYLGEVGSDAPSFND